MLPMESYKNDIEISLLLVYESAWQQTVVPAPESLILVLATFEQKYQFFF